RCRGGVPRSSSSSPCGVFPPQYGCLAAPSMTSAPDDPACLPSVMNRDRSAPSVGKHTPQRLPQEDAADLVEALGELRRDLLRSGARGRIRAAQEVREGGLDERGVALGALAHGAHVARIDAVALER